jgi:hypothetical protein
MTTLKKVRTQLDKSKYRRKLVSLSMIKEKHNEKDSTMGEQEKNAHPINIMGHVIYIFHTFLKALFFKG